MKIFLPYRAEFGWIVMAHAPQVHHAIEQGHLCVVCCERNLEALYPGAQRFLYVDRRLDVERRASTEQELFTEIKNYFLGLESGLEFIEPDIRADAPRSYFIPQPHRPIELETKPDIVICPRKRDYGDDKNWPSWQTLIDLIGAKHLNVFAAGAPDSSYNITTNAGNAWSFERFLDATIQAMAEAKVVIATDCGLAHLAILCGKPLVLISYKDRLVAPGADDIGKPYWPIKIERFEQANHHKVPIEIVQDSWENPAKVLRAALSMIGKPNEGVSS